MADDLPDSVTTKLGPCSEWYDYDIFMDGQPIGTVTGKTRNLDDAIFWLRRAVGERDARKCSPC